MAIGNCKMSCGFTLLEALLAAVVLAMVVGAIVMPFTVGAQNTAADSRQTLAVNLAQDMIEEILTKSFHDPDGTEVGEAGRGNWDDMDDYDGYSEAAGAIASFDGVVVSDPAAVGLTRSVSVEGVYVSGQGAPDPVTFMRITVEVCYHDQGQVELSRLVYANE